MARPAGPIHHTLRVPLNAHHPVFIAHPFDSLNHPIVRPRCDPQAAPRRKMAWWWELLTVVLASPPSCQSATRSRWRSHERYQHPHRCHSSARPLLQSRPAHLESACPIKRRSSFGFRSIWPAPVSGPRSTPPKARNRFFPGRRLPQHTWHASTRHIETAQHPQGSPLRQCRQERTPSGPSLQVTRPQPARSQERGPCQTRGRSSTARARMNSASAAGVTCEV